MFTLITAMCIFSLTMSITPGPVNMVIVASGASYGFRRTLPFISGATIGFILLLITLGLGLMQFVTAYPTFLNYMSIAGSSFIIYIGYKIGTAKPELTIEDNNCPNFKQGFIMQWLNPKAWLACIAGLSMFMDEKSHDPLILFSTLYFAICYLSLSLWAILGSKVGIILSTPNKIRIFNVSMGSLLCTCAAYLFFESVY
ncbi:LysE family translocator [Desulfovibrio gilichinskyi]|uniref:Threonine/homoserine/homoserine lactone efflux protein n=1 Tax=Desulfovibrio gilichinskyi TaxID=1519643 RepID=A0A1X7C9V2_9BACT|nr:LysE family translocator [Desulfovibrio gilichinskyi]SME92646.1 Threonine/homoserine/homoserine lactone efflux protein [Desulfovibrio gilichinskyi]